MDRKDTLVLSAFQAPVGLALHTWTSNSMKSVWLVAAFRNDSIVFSRTWWSLTFEAPEPRCLLAGSHLRDVLQAVL
jgi:hypothetical protein